MRVLYITSIENYREDGSVRYRCYNFAEQLFKDYNVKTEVIHQNELDISVVNNYSIFIFHRPQYSSLLLEFINLLKTGNKVFIADYDDLIFDLDCIEETSLYKNYNIAPNRVRSIISNFYRASQLFKNFIVSTEELKKRLKGNILVLKNSLSERWLSMREKFQNKSENRIIGYFCGSQTHNLDFKKVENQIRTFLKENKEYTLKIVGPLDTNLERVRRLPRVPYYELPRLISGCSFMVAPLEINTFTKCKSRVKFIESMSLGVPCLCSPIPDMSVHETQGNIITENWKDSLSLICNTDLKNKKIIEFEKNLDTFKVSYETKKLFIFLKDLLDNLPKVKKLEVPNVGIKCLETKAIIGEIFGKRIVSQEFKSPLDNLYQIQICVATYARINTADLQISIHNSTGFIHRETLPSSKLSDNSWLAISFTPQKKSKGANYIIQISSPKGRLGNAVTLYYDPYCVLKENLTVGTLTLRGSLCIKTFHLP